MLANYGYFGHMWELYAMWTATSFFAASFNKALPETSPWLIALISIIVIGIAGGVGCVVGGWVADGIGRCD